MKKSKRRFKSLMLLLVLTATSLLSTHHAQAQQQATFNGDLPSTSTSTADLRHDDRSSDPRTPSSTWLSQRDEDALQRLLLCPPLPPDSNLAITEPLIIPLKASFSPQRVCLSFLVSLIGSIACLELLLKMSPRASKDKQDIHSEDSEGSWYASSGFSTSLKRNIRGWDLFNLREHRWLWLLGAAFAFGGGTTWAMHFISESQTPRIRTP